MEPLALWIILLCGWALANFWLLPLSRERWFAILATGEAQSAAGIASDEELTRSYVTRVMRLAFLAPEITEAILDGRQPPNLNTERLVRRSRLPLLWDDQRRLLGIDRR